MIVRVRLFAAARQEAGSDLIDVTLKRRATVADLRDALAGQLPALANLFARAAFAIDAEYAADSRIVPDDADVACIPPVSGG